MDVKSSFNLEIWIVAPNTRGRGYCLSKVVDADFTKPPSALIKLWMLTSPSLQADFNIQVCSNQDLLEMFGKHEASKCCLLTVCYHSPGSEPPDIPDWDFSTGQSVEAPFTPSMPCPSIAEPSLQTQTQSADHGYLANPNPSNEHVGVDEEGLYIELGSQPPKPPNSEPRAKQRQAECSQSDPCYDTDIDNESSSSEDDEI